MEVGDIVKRVKDGWNDCPFGEEVLLVPSPSGQPYPPGRVWYKSKTGKVWSAGTEYFELVRTARKPIMKGDRAERVKNGVDACPLGTIVDVVNVEGAQVWYIDKDGSELWGYAENFRRVEPAVPPALVQVETREVYSIIPGNHGRLKIALDATLASQLYAGITRRLPDTGPVPLVPVNAEELDTLAEQFKTLAEALRNAAK